VNCITDAVLKRLCGIITLENKQLAFQSSPKDIRWNFARGDFLRCCQIEAYSYFSVKNYMILISAVLSLYTHITDRKPTDNRTSKHELKAAPVQISFWLPLCAFWPRTFTSALIEIILYYFLIMINCDLSYISHSFRDIIATNSNTTSA